MNLSVQARTEFGKKTQALRKQGLVPAVVYGRHLKTPLHVCVNKVQMVKTYHAAGMSTPIELIGTDIQQLVLFHHVQVDPISDHMIHAEFLAVNKDEKVRAEVPLKVIGESPFEKNGLGTVQLIKSSVHVIALPLDLPHSIEVDISVIEYDSHSIHISDLKVSDKVQIDENPEDTVVSASLYKEEEEEVVATPTAEGATPAEGGAEGAAAPEAGSAE